MVSLLDFINSVINSGPTPLGYGPVN